MTRNTFATLAAARAAGLIPVREARWLCNTKTLLMVVDNSGPNSYGYAYYIANRGDGACLLDALSCWLTDEENKIGQRGCFALMFDESAVRQLLLETEAVR